MVLKPMTLHEKIIHVKYEVNKGAHGLSRGSNFSREKLGRQCNSRQHNHATCTSQYCSYSWGQVIFSKEVSLDVA